MALICQSGTIALTLSFNERSVPIGYLFSVGNQTRLAVEDLIEMLCDDPRVTAFGLYLEGIKDTERFARAADKARLAGKPIAVIKSGRTAAAARTAHSHTGALAGADSVFDAFCRQAGLARCDTLGALCETLKLFHSGGALAGRKVLIMGASGGDMAMTADVARTLDLDFAPIPEAAGGDAARASDRPGDDCQPVRYPHLSLVRSAGARARVLRPRCSAGYDAVGFMLDFPPEGKADTSSFDAAIDVYIEASRDAAPRRRARSPRSPRLSASASAQRCLDGGVVPLAGSARGARGAGARRAPWASPGTRARECELQHPARPRWPPRTSHSLSEADGKAALRRFGVPVPRGKLVAPARGRRVRRIVWVSRS